jgi:Zn-dependent protease
VVAGYRLGVVEVVVKPRMFSIFAQLGPEIPVVLLLMGILGLRAKVWPKASVLINASGDRIFDLIDVRDGKKEDWGRTTTDTEMLDATRQYFRKTYTTSLTTGTTRSSSALFSVRHRDLNRRLEIQREGLEGRTLNNELLSQTYELTPEGPAMRLTTTYEWGPRPLLAQLMARADLWGGAYRLKSLAERGVADNRVYQWITAGVAAVTGLISLIGFAVVLGWIAALLLIVSLFVHEFGHLLAYRMIGQPWGRMVFLPFLGAMAIPRLNYDSQAQAVFAALMGPGLSIFLAISCVMYSQFIDPLNIVVLGLGVITIALNLFNLLPMEPLDGGIALRSILTKLFGKYARFGLMAVGVSIAALGIVASQIVFVVFGVIAIAMNFRTRSIDAGLTAMSGWQVGLSLASYFGMIAGYYILLMSYANLASVLDTLHTTANNV